MNYKQQLGLLGSFGTLFLGAYFGFRYTVFQGKFIKAINRNNS